MGLARLWNAIIYFRHHLSLRFAVWLTIFTVSFKWRDWWNGNTTEDRLLVYVKKMAKRGNPTSVVDAVERYYDVEWTMIVDPEKREKIEAVTREKAPMMCFEMGCYIGFSAIVIGKDLPAGGRIITTEPDQRFAKIAREMIEFAGLDKVITVLTVKAEEAISALRSEHSVDKLDFVFIDHDPKSQYLIDLKQLERANLLQQGTLIVADNVLFPGAPDYLGYVENCEKYKTERFNNIMGGFLIPDIVTISTYCINDH